MPQRTISSRSEFELHYHRLLLKRQAERRHGIILVVTGTVYFLLTAACLFFLLSLYSNWIANAVTGIAGIALVTYYVSSGIVSIRSGMRPLTNREVFQWRRKARIALYRQARGELPPGYSYKGRMKKFLLGSGITIFGSLILVFPLIGINKFFWIWILLGSVVLLVELVLMLNIFYSRSQETRNLAAQSAQDLSLLLATGELTTGEIPENQVLEDE